MTKDAEVSVMLIITHSDIWIRLPLSSYKGNLHSDCFLQVDVEQKNCDGSAKQA